MNIRFRTYRQSTAHFIVAMALAACGGKDIVGPEFERSVANDAFKEAFHEGMREKMIGHYEKSIPFFEKCLSLSPGNASVYFALSDMYEKTGQKKLSDDYAVKAWNFDKENKWYTLRLAQISFRAGDFSKSAEYFEMIMQDEKNLDLKFQYAEALIRSNQPKKAIAMLNEIEVETGKAPELSIAKNELYLGIKDEESAELEITSLIDSDPGNIQNYVLVADYFLNSRQPKKAEKIIIDGLHLNPESGELHVMSADMKLRNGQVATAFQDLKKAFFCDDMNIERKLELMGGLMPFAFNPSNPDAKSAQAEMQLLFDQIYDESLENASLHKMFGEFLQRLGKSDSAIRQFRFVAQLNPDSYDTWNQLLTLEMKLKKFMDLYADGQLAFGFYPTQPEFYLFAGVGASETGKFAQAEEWLFLGKDLVVKNDKLKADFLFYLGSLYLHQDRMEDGFTYFDQALTSNPEHADVYARKARYLIGKKNFPQAESLTVEGMKFAPDHSGLLDCAGLILLQKKSHPQAVKIFERALMPDVFNCEILEHYGDALFLLGDADKALEIWNEAKKNGNISETLIRKIADKKYYDE